MDDLEKKISAQLTERLAGILENSEKRQQRRFWMRWVFWVLVLIAISWWVYQISATKQKNENQKDHIAIVEISGALMSGSNHNAIDLIAVIEEAFQNPRAKAVFLRLNSPGGSATQSAMIYDALVRLKQENQKPLFSFVSDICTSGCYYVASASDEIHSHPTSLIGSIGVLLQGFDATELMEKIGIEPRTFKAGDDKELLNPLAQLNDKQTKHIQNQIDWVHQRFIQDIKNQRVSRLKGDDDELFSGLIWVGENAKRLGLIDGFEGEKALAQARYAIDNFQNYQTTEDWWNYVAHNLKAETLKVLGVGGFMGLQSYGQ